MKNKKTKDLFSREFKLTHLGYGDWLDEPDVMYFDYKGIQCLIARVYKREPCKEEAWFGGHLCGYIFLPKDHPCYGKEPHEVDLECHYGITCVESTEDGYMVGFDCAHSGDLVPSMVELRKRYKSSVDFNEIFPIPEDLKNHPWFKPVYRNMSYCVKQCKSMVRQALKMVAQ